MISFALSIISAVFSLVVVLKSKLSQTRGTNKFTRFVRDSVGNARQKQLLGLNAGLGLLFTLTAKGGENQWFAGIPNFAVAILCLVFMIQSNRNKQRVEDARGVTKGSLQIAAATAETAGATVGSVAESVYHVPGASKLGQGIGKAVGSVANSCADSMTDVQTNINVAEIKSMISPEEFMRLASMAGCKGSNFEQLAEDVYRNIPSGYIESHSSLSPAQIAVNYLNGSR